MQGKSISTWMRSFNYGLPISSQSARTAAGHFRSIVGLLVLGLLGLHFARLWLFARAIPQVLALLLGASMALYLVYMLARSRMPASWEARYYAPYAQFLLAQASVVSTAVLIGAYAFYDRPNLLWPLFLLPILIISDHCGTNWLLGSVIQVVTILLGAAWSSSRQPFPAFWLSPSAFEGMMQALTITLFTFLLHYVMRNLDARDHRIGQLRGLLVHIAPQLPMYGDPHAIRQTSLRVFMEAVGAQQGAVWIAARRPGVLQLAASARDPSCSIRADALPAEVRDLDPDSLLHKVIQSNSAHCTVRSGQRLGTLPLAMASGPPLCAEARVEIGVPLHVFQPHRPDSVAVLTLDFVNPMGRAEVRRVYLTAVEIAGILSPVFYYVSLMEEHLALRDLGYAVSHSLEQMSVVDALLDLLTTTLGFDFATVSLVDEVEQTIGTVRGSNVDPEWVRRAVHSLDSHDIQAWIVRTGKTEVLSGWDERFDRDIWERFGHDQTVRIFVPLAVVDKSTGRPKNIGTVETGYWRADRAKITQEQIDLLEPFVSQAAIAVYNAQLHEQARQRADSLERLHDVGNAIQQAVWSLPRLMKEIGEAALDVLQADIVFLYQYDQDARRIEFLHTAGEVWGQSPLALRLGEGNILDWIIAHREPFYTSDAQNSPVLVGHSTPEDGRIKYRTFTQRQHVRAFAGIPLMAGKRLVGMMCVNYRKLHHFSHAGTHIIELFAQMAAVALETARLKELDKEQALHIQRNQLARELHDALVQDLYGIGLKVRTWLQEPGLDPAKAAELRQILELAEEANGQIGYLVAELRAPLLSQQDFRQTIQETVERVRRFYDLALTCQDNGVGQIGVPSSANSALAHVAKESITNAVRHARAQHISVRYEWQPSGRTICLQVEDDGIGFDPDHHRDGGHGLRTMREFAHEAGGELHVRSAPGQGTRITALVPVDER